MRSLRIFIPLAILITFAASAGAATRPDRYEKDNSWKQARKINVNDPLRQHHNFHQENDVDWVKFKAAAGKSYTLEIMRRGERSSAGIALFDPDGVTPTGYEECQELDGRVSLDWQAPLNATYYLRISPCQSGIFDEETEYDLRVIGKNAPDMGHLSGYFRHSDSQTKIAHVYYSAGCQSGREVDLGNRSYWIGCHPGTYQLEATRPGYEPLHETITIVEGRITNKDFFMTPLPQDPDLVAASITGPESASRGEAIKVVITLKNNGESAAGPFKMMLLLSLDRSVSTSKDIFLKTQTVKALGALATLPLTTTVSLPSDLAPGVYYLGAKLDDPDDVAELRENNNSRAASKAIQIK